MDYRRRGGFEINCSLDRVSSIMILTYITCKNKKEADTIGVVLLEKKLAVCFVVIPKVEAVYWWKGKKEKSSEAILLVKTIGKKFLQIEREVKKVHSYDIPCILEIPIGRVHKPYLKWFKEASKEY
jgi:periplasmic divalent cation tolerance protein